MGGGVYPPPPQYNLLWGGAPLWGRRPNNCSQATWVLAWVRVMVHTVKLFPRSHHTLSILRLGMTHEPLGRRLESWPDTDETSRLWVGIIGMVIGIIGIVIGIIVGTITGII